MSLTVLTRPREPVLPAILLLALAIRLWVLATHTYIAHPDETFQYLEPAHRLAFGSGVITWEFLDGIRSWLLPGIIAGIWRLVALVDGDPNAGIFVLRLLCVIASLSVPYAGYRIAERVAGREAAWVAALLCALSPQAIYFAPVIMTEPLATDCALLAVAIGGGANGRTRPLFVAGALFGLAATLRYQFAPALALTALWQFGRDRRTLLVAAAGGLAVVVLGLGVLDAATWGMPFRSVWLNFLRNGVQGVSQAMGAEGSSFYAAYYLVAWGVAAPVILICLGIGARRAPVLAVLTFGMIGVHMLTPHKEVRFVLPATEAMPILVGIGLSMAVARLPARWSGASVRLGVTLVIGAAVGWSTLANATQADAWHRDRALLRATAAAREVPGVCGLAIRTAWVYRSPGYSYWHRASPLYFETWFPAQVLPGSDFPLRLDSVLAGRSVPQFQPSELARQAHAFNAIVGAPTDGLPGYTEQSCFGAGVLGDPKFCVFTRPGGCD